ncbi:MAG: hypothetical protein J7493_10440 [Porphyrobacter sp.]|nr:hypothetical protein [Porphyrobacter sp.]
MGPDASAEQRALNLVDRCIEPAKLKQIAQNARNAGADDVERAALLKLYSVMPAAKLGTLEHDVWQSVYALEGALKQERGKTTLLARTRQKLQRDGELKTVSDLVLGKESAGFQMLIDRNMPELTFEAVALRHALRFDGPILNAARARLENVSDKTGEGTGQL